MHESVFWIPHTHWDREWYRSFQAFRARLVDCIDAVLDQLAADPGFTFLLDGQTVVLEDYLEIRPQREAELRNAVSQGRLAIGPWYVQPDSLLPGGEAHIRNLAIGRELGAQFGPVSDIAYTPDSFGHPAQYPQLFCGFGLRAFVYWRGNGNELRQLPNEYRWRAPDGSSVIACLLARGYSNGAFLPTDSNKAIKVLKIVYLEATENTEQQSVLIMNGVDHAPPHPDAMALAQGLARSLDVDVRVGLLGDFVDSIKEPLPEYRGSLTGSKLASLLPGVWSARMPLKLANRRIETKLLTLAEPMAALARQHGLQDERASLRTAWKSLLQNQAHDSIGGCSIDQVHRQMLPRFYAAGALADETANRIMERLAGQALTRQTPLTQPFEVAIYNPSPYRRSGYARLKLDAHPSLAPAQEGAIYHPVLAANKPEGGYTAAGVSVRFIPADSDGRFFHDQHQHACDLEIPVTDVPAYGYKRMVLERADHTDETVDDSRTIANCHMRLALDADGSVELEIGGRHYAGLFGIEDRGDRGDSYDADILPLDGRCDLLRCRHRRRLHDNGTQILEVERLYRVPRELDRSRVHRSVESTAVRLFTDYILYPESNELRVAVRLENTARDHRLRLLFPAGGAGQDFSYATTFDVAHSRNEVPDDSDWLQPASSCFVHQGWIHVNGLSVVAAGLPEAEVLQGGTLAITLVRSIGWLSRHDLKSRSGPAGPVIPAVEAQCLETIEAELVLFAGFDPIKAQQAEVPLAAVFAGDAPLMPPDSDMLTLHSDTLLLSAFKPAADGDDYILSLLNPGAEVAAGQIVVGFDLVTVQRARLDEQAQSGSISLEDARRFWVELQPHQLQTLRLSPRKSPNLARA